MLINLNVGYHLHFYFSNIIFITKILTTIVTAVVTPITYPITSDATTVAFIDQGKWTVISTVNYNKKDMHNDTNE